MPLVLFDAWWWTEHGLDLELAIIEAGDNDIRPQPVECEILDDDERFVVGLACSVAKAASVTGAALVITDPRTAADHVEEIMARLRLLVERAQNPVPRLGRPGSA